ncbi:uncharacterized protein [Ptychodera flava]|uniref:uncharacterized protein n=1 Tax=Ptychodera flava TaxID=63121 RepID=UPI00396A9033
MRVVGCLLCLFVLLTLVTSCFSKKREIQKAASQLIEKESKKVDTSSCKSSNADHIVKLRLKDKGKELLACLLKNLELNVEDGWTWSELGTMYDRQGETSKATTCLKQAAKLSGKISSHIQKWHYIGPFVVGKPEVDGDPLEFYGSVYNASRQRYDKKVKYYSELVNGCEIQWKKITQKTAADSVQVNPQINWNELVSGLGSLAITEWQGWAVGEFAVNQQNENVLIQCLGITTMFVDGIFLAGDVYRRSQYWYSVPLTHGIHTLYVKLRTKGTQVFQCNIKISGTEVLEVHEPIMKPDLVDGHLFGHMIAVPVSNLHSSKWIKSIKVTIASHSYGSPVIIHQSEATKRFGIAPGQTIPVTIEIHHKDETDNMPCKDTKFILKFSTSDGHSQQLPITLRCRNSDESFVYTFRDHDGSVQQAAAIAPLEDCPNDVCPVLLTLHGTGVAVQNQADSYKRMENGKWIFGLETAWVLASTRHGAHNWEGPGALTSITALDMLKKLSQEASWLQSKASAHHVIFAGHSMGGHGAWHLATHYPDRALAVMSLAGWIKKEEYGDSNEFFRHDTSTSHTDPAVKAIMEACIAENNADIHISNLKHVEILTRIGANDRTVHPYFVRRMYRLLKEQNSSVSYDELPGKEHWWWDTWETNDGGAVNDKQLRDFVGKHSKNIIIGENDEDEESYCDTEDCDDVGTDTRYSGAQTASERKGQYTLTLINPAFMEGLHGVKVIQQTVPFRISRVEMDFSSDKVTMVTTNVAKFTLYEPVLSPVDWMTKIVKVDGSEFSGKAITQIVTGSSYFCKLQGKWSVCQMESPDFETHRQRGPANLGPARRVAENQFLIVTGTHASADIVATLQQLAVYIANLFFLTSDTIAPVFRDNDLTEDTASQYNLIVLGGPQENSWTKKILQNGIPLTVDENGIGLGECLFSHHATGALLLAPHRGNGLALLLLGNSIQGVEDVVRLASPTIPPMTRSPFSNLVPDYIITGADFKKKGPGGYLCTGFWGNQWDYRRETASCAC